MTARHHHYVPQWYLQRWANKEGRVLCSRNGNVLPRMNPRNLLGKRDFYAAPSLTQEDIALLSHIVLQQMKSDNARSMAKTLLEGAIYESRLKTEILPSRCLSRPERKKLSSYLTECEEKRLERSETRAQIVIKRLLDGDVAVLKESNPALDFFQFLGEMFFRTVKSREKMREAVELGLLSEGGAVVMARILAANTASVQFFDRAAMPATLLRNSTKQQFVTSDNPVVNVLSPAEQRIPEEDEWAMYFPLSPTRALVVPPWNHRFEGQTAVTEELAANLNAWMVNGARETLVARERDSLLAAEQMKGRRCPSMRKWFREANDPLPLKRG